ncbi:MAG: hypothetical protein ABIH68_07855 [bacterium]
MLCWDKMRGFPVFLLLFLSIVAFAKTPSGFLSPPENEEFFYFLASSTASAKNEAFRAAKSDIVSQAAAYIGDFFEKNQIKVTKETYSKDIKTEIFTCFLLARYPATASRDREFMEESRRRQIDGIFNRAVERSKKLSSKDRIIDAIGVISRAKADPRLPSVKKDELSNLIKELITRIKLRPMEYARTADTRFGLQGEAGVLVSVFGKEESPVSDINVSFLFETGSGFIEKESVLTDKKGLAVTKILRFNTPGKTVIAARIVSDTVPEFALVHPVKFEVDVKGKRHEIVKRSVALARGISKNQNILLLKDNVPLGVVALKIILQPLVLGGSVKIIPTTDTAGFAIDEQVNTEGVKIGEISREISVPVDEIEEGKNYSIQIQPVEIIFQLSKIQKQKDTHPLKGEIETIKSLIFNFVIYYL